MQNSDQNHRVSAIFAEAHVKTKRSIWNDLRVLQFTVVESVKAFKFIEGLWKPSFRVSAFLDVSSPFGHFRANMEKARKIWKNYPKHEFKRWTKRCWTALNILSLMLGDLRVWNSSQTRHSCLVSASIGFSTTLEGSYWKVASWYQANSVLYHSDLVDVHVFVLFY